MDKIKFDILIVDDNEDALWILKEDLLSAGYNVYTANGGEKALSLIKSQTFDLIMSDLKMPGIDGLRLLESIQELGSSTNFILMSGQGTIDIAVQAVKNGAYDFLSKPYSVDELYIKVEHSLESNQISLENQRLKLENSILREEINEKYDFSNIVGESDSVTRMLTTISIICDKSDPVLLFGENGTGKELIAKSIHFNSYRKDNPFIPVFCGSIPESLFESELFGYTKGSFTGATNTKQGILASANKGTVFFDEISEVPLSMQVKLLRFIQSKEIKQIGNAKPFEVDVRILSASNKDLKQLINEGKFREDLYYRLNVIQIDIPPLRNRKEDIPLLIDKILSEERNLIDGVKRIIDRDLMKLLINYDWPGNVRQLENVIRRMVILSNQFIISVDDLPAELITTSDIEDRNNLFFDIPDNISIDELEKLHITRVLEKVRWKKTAAVKILGISRSTLDRKLKEFKIEK